MAYNNLTTDAMDLFASAYDACEGEARLLDVVRSFLGGEFIAIPSGAFNALDFSTAYYSINFESDTAGEASESRAYFLPGSLVVVDFDNGERFAVIRK